MKAEHDLAIRNICFSNDSAQGKSISVQEMGFSEKAVTHDRILICEEVSSVMTHAVVTEKFSQPSVTSQPGDSVTSKNKSKFCSEPKAEKSYKSNSIKIIKAVQAFLKEIFTIYILKNEEVIYLQNSMYIFRIDKYMYKLTCYDFYVRKNAFWTDINS